MIAILDYGSGKLRSAQRAFELTGHRVQITSEADVALSSDGLVVPGVGAFGACMEQLSQIKGADIIRSMIEADKPLFGICVGMQILGSFSEEFGHHEGLGIIPGAVRLIPGLTPTGERVKRPHVGWSSLYKEDSASWQDTPLEGMPQEVAMYFVHSYQLTPDDSSDLLAQARYGDCAITASVRRGRVFGLQFHPEKSGYAGLRILKRFVLLSCANES